MNLVNFEFEISENFEPSHSIKKAGLFTKKSSHLYAGVTLPGFFQTTGYSWQLIGFLSIFLLEGIATYWSYNEGGSIQVVIGLILFDIVLALASHWKHSDIVLAKNQIIFQSGALQQQTKRKLLNALIWRNTFYFLIIFSGVTKFLFFFLIYMIFDARALLIGFFYLIGSILHILCTGYALFTLRFKIGIANDHSNYISSDAKQYVFNTLKLPINAGNEKLTPVVVGLHEIMAENGIYYFQTKGILNDRELGNMIARQENDNSRRIIAVEGVKHQYEIYGMNPVDQLKTK